MRVLILGGSGMLGHKVYQVLGPRFDVFATMRKSAAVYLKFGIFDERRLFGEIDVRNFEKLSAVISKLCPHAIINCIGVIKQLHEAREPLPCITLNALLPHFLHEQCLKIGARLVQVSTDCVFSGKRGAYREEDVSDADDLYGRTKFLGEVSGPNALTLRTSIIGRELNSCNGLVEWFLSQEGRTVCGYRKAIFSGFPTAVLARLIGTILEKHERLTGLYHVSSDAISKYDLLQLLKIAYRCNIHLEENEAFCCDRSLDSTRFRRETGIFFPSWPEMIEEMSRDLAPDQAWRKCA